MRTNARPSPRRCNDFARRQTPQILGLASTYRARRRGRPKRNKLTHKHTDLKDLFNAERRARDSVPDSELRLRDEITALTKKIKALKEERDQYRTASETFARAMNVLTVENDNLRRDIEKRRSSSVTSLPSRR